MALGKQIGAFTLKGDAWIYTRGPGQGFTAQISFSGLVTGEIAGNHRGTMTVVTAPGATDRRFDHIGLGDRAVNQREIVALHRSLLQLAHQMRLRNDRFGDD